jgi:hypothetical protein
LSLPSFLRLFLSPIPPPPFRFNRELYARLIQEKGTDGPIIAPAHEPDVEFAMGPLDGMLGSYDVRTGKIMIDVLENFMVVLRSPADLLDPEDLKRRFDVRMTETIAHEGGHWRLDKRLGMKALIDKFVMLGLFLILGLGGLALLGRIYWFGVLGYLAIPAFASHTVLGYLGSGAAVIVGALIYLNIIRIYLGFWKALSFGLTYQLCYHERYARRFAREAEADKRWEGVIQV